MTQLADRLLRALEGEILLYESYLELLGRQRDSVTRFRLDQFEKRTAKVEQLCEQMGTYAEKRKVLMQEHAPEWRDAKLSAFLREVFPKHAALHRSATRLKQLVEESRKEALEFSQVTQFALNMVNGGLSILWQATQNVTRRYGPQGELTESYAPTRSRKETTLKEA